MIRHSVIFKFNDAIGSDERRAFFLAAHALAAIEGVQQFEILKQTSQKNGYDYGITMKFDNAEQYRRYNNHPAHSHFVQVYWLSMVKDFLEIDFEPLEP